MGNWFAGRQKSDPLPERDANGDRKFGWDGKTPNTAGDKRFYRNRESGYDGWIDKDGYRCDGNGRRTGGDA
jgi:hypothetical protein